MKHRSPIKIRTDHVLATLQELQKAGKTDGKERIALWLGKRTDSGIEIVEVHIPEQVAGEDFFHIPPEAMKVLMARLREIRGMVVAQVHSHPQYAFHSEADDRWAIIRHEGALSLVIPFFGLRTTPSQFWEHTKTYEFSPQASWVEIKRSEVANIFVVPHE